MRRSVCLSSFCLSLLALVAMPSFGDPKDAAPRDTASGDAAPKDAAAKGPAKPLSTRGVLLDRVAAVVNDGVVLQSELDAQSREIEARLRAQNVALPPESVLRGQVLDRLVQEEIQQQHADRAGIRVSDEQVNAALEDIARRQNLTLEQLPQKLAADNIDYAQYRVELRKEIARQILRQRDVVQRIVVTPRELDQYLEHQKKTASAANEYNIAHILIAVAQDAKPAQLAQASKLAHEVDERARSGEEFGALAVTYSQSESALEGGSLGWRKGTELPTFLADVVARMQPGDVSDVLQTPSGFHIVKLLETRAAGGPQIVQQVHLRHILLKPTEIEDDATVEQKLARWREQIVSGKEQFAAFAKTYSQDSGSAVNGGDLGWSESSAFVPDFAAVVARLKDGEISQPFHTQYGWHIVQLLGRRDFDNTNEAARERAFEAMRDSRVEEATELWLQQIRDESYVELRL
jgi:peptidyl-prolyl cis-trans isomerase SurA